MLKIILFVLVFLVSNTANIFADTFPNSFDCSLKEQDSTEEKIIRVIIKNINISDETADITEIHTHGQYKTSNISHEKMIYSVGMLSFVNNYSSAVTLRTIYVTSKNFVMIQTNHVGPHVETNQDDLMDRSKDIMVDFSNINYVGTCQAIKN